MLQERGAPLSPSKKGTLDVAARACAAAASARADAPRAAGAPAQQQRDHAAVAAMEALEAELAALRESRYRNAPSLMRIPAVPSLSHPCCSLLRCGEQR